jgi:hypothetical protein
MNLEDELWIVGLARVRNINDLLPSHFGIVDGVFDRVNNNLESRLLNFGFFYRLHCLFLLPGGSRQPIVIYTNTCS